jgi:hypothetical protein
MEIGLLEKSKKDNAAVAQLIRACLMNWIFQRGIAYADPYWT